ncbi:MAG TPA: hypothetical protein VGE47_12755, partial [Burkholderiaceae bacterium]
AFNRLPTFSAGVVNAHGGHYEDAQSISAALIEPKHVAKSRSGGSRYFVCRRTPQEALEPGNEVAPIIAA